MSRPNLRTLAALFAASAIAALVLAPAASASGDPVASGHFDLAFSPAFKEQLKAKRTSVRARGVSIETGSVDPVSGTASLKLSGSLKFQHRDKTVVFENLTATLGPDGALEAGALNRHGVWKHAATSLFQLSGGSVVREGFGAKVSGVQASLAPSGAGRLGRRLGVHLPSGNAGSLAVYTQPETVAVLSGLATVTQDLSPGGIAPKLRAHCIDPVDGVTASGAATKPAAGSFLIPVAGGTISPDGWNAGNVDLAGGLDVTVGGPGLPAGCPTSVVATIHFANFAVDVAHTSVLTDLTVGGPYSPFPNTVIPVELQGSRANATMLADPSNHSLTASGAQLGLDQVSAQMMNNLLPHASGGSIPSFNAGDLLGSADMTVQTR
jgi:hypothetical protein